MLWRLLSNNGRIILHGASNVPLGAQYDELQRPQDKRPSACAESATRRTVPGRMSEDKLLRERDSH
jgi:hypothetical protein